MRRSITLLVLAAALTGCRTPGPRVPDVASAVDRARAALLAKYPDLDPESLRLESVLSLDHASPIPQNLMVVFEDVTTILVSTNFGNVERSVVTYEAHVAADGRIASLNTGRHSCERRREKER